MYLLGRLLLVLRRHVRQLAWGTVATALLCHMALTWLLLAWAGEARLTGWESFPYYYMTTATTIGYGDLSPSTVAGRYIAALVLMPGSVALFAAALGKTGVVLVAFWRRRHMGKMNYSDLSGHTVLVGWRGVESLRPVQLLLSDSTTDDEGVVLVATGLHENPAPDHLRFVATESYADTSAYPRAGIGGAARVIVNPATDDQTLAAVLGVMAHAPTAHVVAHFDSEGAARLVGCHYPGIECTRPLTAELLARAAQDPGSAAVTEELLSVKHGPTQYSVTLPTQSPPLPYLRLAAAFSALDALLLGYRGPDGALQVNPRHEVVVPSGSQLYYLAEQRLPAQAWTALAEGVR